MTHPKPIPTIRRKREAPVWLILIAFILGASAAAQFYTEFFK